jgi:hypothetical protein
MLLVAGCASNPGFEGALRAGGAVPFGRAPPQSIEHATDVPQPLALRDMYSPMFALQADLGARVSPYLYLGLFAQWAQGVASTSVAPANENRFALPGHATQTSGGTDVAAGVEVQVHLLPHRVLDPWMGLGFEAESFWGAAWPGSGSPLRMEAGVDWAWQDAAFGPVVSVTRGQIASDGSTCCGTAYGWVTFGVRGLVDFGPSRTP